MREEWKRWRRHTDTTDYWIVRLKRTMTTELLYALLRMQGRRNASPLRKDQHSLPDYCGICTSSLTCSAFSGAGMNLPATASAMI